ncbi:MAG: hypothetical protein KAS60_03845 [Thermoplasmata archaeon]|nr:hypothetical protein [Thermoplasmata archaeon]
MNSYADSRYEQYPWWVLAIIAFSGFVLGWVVYFSTWAFFLVIGGCVVVVIASLAPKESRWPLPVAYYGRLLVLFGLMVILGTTLLLVSYLFLSF